MEEKSAADNSPGISLPKGGGAIQGIGETFSPDLFTGTGNFSIPIFTSPGRSGVGPQLTLQYSSGKGNSIFGLGWHLNMPSITRKTAKGLPRYQGQDVFVMSGAEDLLPKFTDDVNQTIQQDIVTRGSGTDTQRVRITRFIPRNEGLFARIEAWEELTDDDEVFNHFWRVTTKENVTSIYGRTPNARIADANHPLRIYEWLLEETFDAKGNHIAYEYCADSPSLQLYQIEEENREYNQRYPRRIYYGNVADQLTDLNGNDFSVGPSRRGTDHRDPFNTVQRHYLMEVVFDYGDWQLPHNNNGDFSYQAPGTSQETLDDSVLVRSDPFSSYRPGFELRTIRQCQKVLMIHHFQELGGASIVKSIDFHYEESNQTKISFLKSVVLTGYAKKANGNGYVYESMPPVEFSYSEFQPGKQRYQSITAKADDLPAQSLRDINTTTVDMFGNGLPDIVQSSPEGFRYWRNLGQGHLDRPKVLDDAPAGITLAENGVSFADMGGDGLADLVIHNGAVHGFFEMTPEREVSGKLQGGWSPDSFKHYHDSPPVQLNDPNLRMLDLTGDGLTDLLITRDDHFIWYKSKGDDGFELQGITDKPAELKGVSFEDPSGRLRLADVSGDGLNDIVLIHKKRVDYWPNLGYGNFGARITMANAPDLPTNFDPKRLFLADIDGSGTADLVYVDACEAHYWLNGSGNAWSEKQTICGTPVTTDTSSLSFTDFFGNGTACLLWSYDFGTFPGSNLKVLDFSGGVKPYLLNEMDNNLGATLRVRYASSTKYYLDDIKQGNYWATPLPFPVQVVEKTERIDHISKTKLVSCYKYHHGFFDGREREFRGFGRVDQIDSESFEIFEAADLHEDVAFVNGHAKHHVPPTESRTWFHTGAYFENDDIMSRYTQEYFAGVGVVPQSERPMDPEAFQIQGHDFSAIDSDGIVDAYRALRGAMLRREVYAHDNGPDQNFPYTVTENYYRIESKQSKGTTPMARETNPYAAMMSSQKESLSYHYERQHNSQNLIDPRVEHQLSLAIDEFGNVTSSASISYKRRPTNFSEQNRDLVSITEAEYVYPLETETYFRHSVGSSSRAYELTGLSRASGEAYQASDLLADFNGAENIAYEQTPTAGLVQKRLLAHQVTLFWNDDLTDSLPERQLAFHGLAYESYQLALTPAMRQNIYGNRLTQSMGVEGGYRQRNGDTWEGAGNGDWWIPSGTQSIDASKYYHAVESIDPFGNRSQVIYDPYDLFPLRVRDDKDNALEGLIDYRVLKPFWSKDINGNHSEAAFDVLGYVAGAAVMGKAGSDPTQSILGQDDTALEQMRTNSEMDSLSGFEANLVVFDETDEHARYQQIVEYLDNPDGANNAAHSATAIRTSLQHASSRIIYDVHRYRRDQKPATVCMIARETHDHDLQGDVSPLQIGYAYSDGFGREVQNKAQGEPTVDPNTNELRRRWVGSAWTIFNNKGKPVQVYEPFFSDTQDFEFEKIEGKSITNFYDPVDRIVCTVHANNTYQKILFNPWGMTSWDPNDTVLLSPQTDPDIQELVKAYFDELPSFKTWFQERIPDPQNPPSPGNRTAQQESAIKAAEHANTPKITHWDPQGNAFLSSFDNRTEAIETRMVYDIQGNDLSVTDPRGVVAFRYAFDLAARKVHFDSTDAGEKLIFFTVDNKPLYSWDAKNTYVRAFYDELRRTIETRVKKNGVAEYLAEKTVYGEAHPQGASVNLRGSIWKVYDAAGLAQNDLLDYKGNVLNANRRLLEDGTDIELAWPLDNTIAFDEAAATALLESSAYNIQNKFDAIGRTTTKQLPDNTKLNLSYNSAGFLEQLDGEMPDGSSELFVKNIDYDARGFRELIEYGNDVITTYEYEPETLRLIEITTTRPSAQAPEELQRLTYTYDAVGNITQIRDDARENVFNRNQLVEPMSGFTYDAVYRLIEVTGREHEARTACHYQSGNSKQTEFLASPQPTNNAQALLMYTEKYQYDKSGNITQIEHQNSQQTSIRNQAYNNDSNRIVTSSASCSGEDIPLSHDVNGNLERLPHLPTMTWDYKNQLVHAQLNVSSTPNEVFYQYDAAGQRMRKTVVKNNGNLIEERIYLGDYEIYSERQSSGALQKRHESLHVMDDQKRIVLVEREYDPANPGSLSNQTHRYQLDNHLGSSVLELDDNANIISYEEFYPYGGTAYMSGPSQAEVSLKRYRYSGKERDDETGLYYYGVRYYAPWMARWINTDPGGPQDGANLFQFSSSNPIVFLDPNGEQTVISRSHLRIMNTVRDIHMTSDEIAHNEYKHLRGTKGYHSKVGIRAHELTQAEVKSRFPNADVEVKMRTANGKGTDLDIVFHKQKLQIELKAATATVEKSGQQQMKQISTAARKGYAYGLVVARARGEGGGQHYYLNAKETRSAATRAGVRNIQWTGGRGGKMRGFATPGTMGGMALFSGALMVLGAAGDIKGMYDMAETIDEVKAATAPFAAKQSIKEINLGKLRKNSKLDLHFVANGDQETNLIIDANSGKLFTVITEDTDNFQAGDIVQVAQLLRVEDMPVFKDMETGDIYARTNGWQISGPSVMDLDPYDWPASWIFSAPEWDVNYYPDHKKDYGCGCLVPPK